MVHKRENNAHAGVRRGERARQQLSRQLSRISDIALSIHFYEAVLATLPIIVWHFYQVIFDPDVYPVNFAFIDGRVSEELYKEEHELAFEHKITANMRKWKDVITDPDEIKVFMALDGPKYTWRTVSAIARQTGITEDRVLQILKNYNMELTRLSETPSASGTPLVGLLERVG